MGEIDTLLLKSIKSMPVPDMSNLLFDGKGEIELNRRLSMQINKLGFLSRVEQSVPHAKGDRTHTDVVIFNDEGLVNVCIECKSCISPDVSSESIINNNFKRLSGDLLKYTRSDEYYLYSILWTIDWVVLADEKDQKTGNVKYYTNHKRFKDKKLSDEIITNKIHNNFNVSGLGRIIGTEIIGPFDEWNGNKCRVFGTLARAF